MLGKPLGDKIYNALRAAFPDKCTDIFVIEHGSVLRINLNNVRKESVDLPAAIKIVNAILHKEPYSEFNGDYWCSFFYSYGRH
jgi:hypothetical protein